MDKSKLPMDQMVVFTIIMLMSSLLITILNVLVDFVGNEFDADRLFFAIVIKFYKVDLIICYPFSMFSYLCFVYEIKTTIITVEFSISITCRLEARRLQNNPINNLLEFWYCLKSSNSEYSLTPPNHAMLIIV